ncbi:hypothetical protein KM043_002326 [Ampulex compressa]|nr:hypothetical protein KM043_002326 [Ampulex compressa]
MGDSLGAQQTCTFAPDPVCGPDFMVYVHPRWKTMRNPLQEDDSAKTCRHEIAHVSHRYTRYKMDRPSVVPTRSLAKMYRFARSYVLMPFGAACSPSLFPPWTINFDANTRLIEEQGYVKF